MTTADSFSFWCGASNMRWAIAGIFLALVGAAMLASGLAVTVDAAPQTAFAAATLAGIAGNYRRGARSPRLAVVAEALLMLIVIFSAGIVMSYAAATSGMPWRDAELVAIDAAFGFDWGRHAAFVDSLPWLSTASFLVYIMLIPQLFVMTITLASSGRFLALHRFVIALCFALLATCVTFIFTPALGAYAHFGMSPDSFANLTPIVTSQHIGPIQGLRSGAITSLSLSDAHGLISFPSFHAAGAVLIAWSFWSVPRARWPFLILNLLMIAATPVQGAHYLIDVIIGLAIAAISIVLAVRLSRVKSAPVAGHRPAAPHGEAA
jgi:membrane-associated phospholipid phosphatase